MCVRTYPCFCILRPLRSLGSKVWLGDSEGTCIYNHSDKFGSKALITAQGTAWHCTPRVQLRFIGAEISKIIWNIQNWARKTFCDFAPVASTAPVLQAGHWPGPKLHRRGETQWRWKDQMEVENNSSRGEHVWVYLTLQQSSASKTIRCNVVTTLLENRTVLPVGASISSAKRHIALMFFLDSMNFCGLLMVVSHRSTKCGQSCTPILEPSPGSAIWSWL